MRARPIAVAVAALAVVPTYPLAAQHFSIGPQVAFGDYRETTSDLHYRGGGVDCDALATGKGNAHVRGPVDAAFWWCTDLQHPCGLSRL